MTDLPAADAAGDLHVPEDLYSSWSASFSPDARRVAFISDRRGEPEVWLRTIDGSSMEAVPLLGKRVTAVSWSPSGEWLACTVAATGSTRSEVWVVRPDDTDARRVAGDAGCSAEIAGGRSDGWTTDDRLVVTELSHTSRIVCIDPQDGRSTVLHEGDLLMAVDVSADGNTLLLRRGPRGKRRLMVVAGEEVLSVVPAGDGTSDAGCLTPDGKLVYACTDTHAELARLEAGPLVVSRPDGELDAVALSGDGRVVALTWNVDGGTSAVTVLDTRTGRQHDVALPRSVVDGCRLSRDGRMMLLTAEGPADPKGVWYGPVRDPLVALSSPGRGTLKAARGATASSIEPAEVVPPVLHRIDGFHGVELTGWLVSPPGAGPHPTLLWFHGGPEAQERPVYNSLFQTLVAAGIGVFAPNVRGSTGFGRSFRNTTDGAGRDAAFDDVAACAAYLTESGIVPQDALAVGGRSYGGYLTLVALTRFPKLFAAGVAVCGMSDLNTWYATTEPWIAATAVSRYGDPERDAELLTSLSPLNALDRLVAPLLLVHGNDDTNVPVTESLQVARALQERGAAHRLLTFDGEGHELLGTANRVTFVQETLSWLDEHLLAAGGVRRLQTGGG